MYVPGMEIKFPDTCPHCEAPFEHIGHPMKPGVIMMSICKCVRTIIPGEGGTVTVLESPKVAGMGRRPRAFWTLCGGRYQMDWGPIEPKPSTATGFSIFVPTSDAPDSDLRELRDPKVEQLLEIIKDLTDLLGPRLPQYPSPEEEKLPL